MKPVALCLGGAKSVWSDLERARPLVGDRPCLIVACNFAGIDFPGHLDAWVTLHPEHFDSWRDARAGSGRNTDYRAFAHATGGNAATEIVAYRRYGSSGLYMAQISVEALGASGTILCGVPMDDSGGHIHWPGAWGASHHYRTAFLAAHAAGVPIRSMSGWTAHLFGKPDSVWIEEIGHE